MSGQNVGRFGLGCFGLGCFGLGCFGWAFFQGRMFRPISYSMGYTLIFWKFDGFSMNITYTIKSNMVLLNLFYVFWMSET